MSIVICNSLKVRVSPVAYALVRRAFPLQINRNYSCEEDQVTHTGQKWEANDYRMARFLNAKKNVNNNWAVKLIDQVPPTEVQHRIVWCDGGSGPEGHPRVYINLDKPGDHTCGYCGLRFFKRADHH